MLGLLIDGKKHAEIAAMFGVSRRMVLRYFLGQGEERVKRYRQAQALLSIALIDDADTLLENASEFESASVQKAKHRADLKRWMASKFNPSQFGDKVEVSHTLGFSDQLLAVLKERGRPRLPVPEAEFEVIDSPGVEALPNGHDSPLPNGQSGMASAAEPAKMAESAADMAHSGNARGPTVQELAVPDLSDLLDPA